MDKEPGTFSAWFFITTSAEGMDKTIPLVGDKGYHMAAKKNVARPDHDGAHRRQYLLNKKKILATQNICAICGKPVDKTLAYPHPLSACVDHIIPIAKGGHPSDIDNLQLAHWQCNRAKSDKLVGTEQDFKEKRERAKVIGNRNLPQSADWLNY